jgi:hypothetical protein
VWRAFPQPPLKPSRGLPYLIATITIIKSANARLRSGYARVRGFEDGNDGPYDYRCEHGANGRSEPHSDHSNGKQLSRYRRLGVCDDGLGESLQEP